MTPEPRDGLILGPHDDDPPIPTRPPRERFHLTTRALMLATAIGTIEVFVLAEAHRIGPGIEFTLFIGATLVTLDLLVPGTMRYLDQINSVPPEEQTGVLLNIGCLLVLIGLLTVPVSLVLLLR